MVDRLIRNVRVKRKISGFATYIDKRHHGISADLLERKWGIGLDKSTRKIQPTTQDNVRSALKLLTWRYRTDFLLQRLRRLNCIFYIGTLFAKDKSIVGNKCAQIFTDREFLKRIPMRSKSEAGTTLDRINRDTGVENEIFMDNAADQTILTQKYREWQDWQSWKSKPLSHTHHGKKI